MEIRELTREELKAVYETEMKNAFPPAELKPFSAMERLMDRGVYRPLGLFEDGALVSYLLLWTDASGQYALGDYLGTVASRRNGGLGGKFLQMVFTSFPEFNCIFGEVEAPGQEASEEENALRRRRLAFYERNGLRYLNYDCALFGVHYRCLAYGGAPDEAVLKAHQEIYASAFPPDKLEKYVQIPLLLGEAVKPVTDWEEGAFPSLAEYEAGREEEAVRLIQGFWLAHNGYRQTEEEAKADLRAWTGPGHKLYFITLEDVTVGLLHLGSRGGEIDWLEDLFILPEYQGRGIGSQVIRLAESMVRQYSPSMYIEAAARNERAIRLYRRLGYDCLNTVTIRKDFPGYAYDIVREEQVYGERFEIRKDKETASE